MQDFRKIYLKTQQKNKNFVKNETERQNVLALGSILSAKTNNKISNQYVYFQMYQIQNLKFRASES